METCKVRGYFASQRAIHGQVMVVSRPLDLLSIDPLTGTFESSHEQAGNSVKDKILIAPCLCGATIAEFIPLFLSMTGNKPGAIVTTASRAYTPIMSGCLASETPFLYSLDKGLAATIRTDDSLRIDVETGEVTVTKKDAKPS